MDSNKRHLVILRIVFLLVLLGWILIWVLVPTKTYKQSWTPKLNNKLNSTYFEEQGTNLLLFTFPVMLIAALSCVYLHFQKTVDKSDSKSTSSRHRLTLWRRPVLVMAPLGIVTAMELVFAAMFVVLLIWWQAKFRSVSLRLGYIGNICWAFLFFPVTRGSSILPLVGLTSESSIKYHIWLGHLSMILFTAHSVGFIIYWTMTNQMAEMLAWSRTYVPNIAGEIAFVIALTMWVTSYPRVRRKMFEVFFYTHHLYALYIFFYALHVGVAYLCMILPGIFLFLVDRYLRFLQSMKRARLVSARLLPCGAFELNFSKIPGLNYNPTSILFVNAPSISKLQWHPFTVTSNCNMESDRLSITIKCGGSWTQRLYQELSTSVNHLQVSVEGPYGPASSHFLRRESLVLVSGGSGITPFISIIRELIFQSTQPNKSHIPRVVLVCAFKNSADLTLLDLLLPISGPTADLSKLQFQIEAYITRETDHPTTTTTTGTTHNPLQTIWFKPSPSDWPITPALGPNSWLWLATSAVFLWQKRRNVRECKQIQNVEVPTPTTSPGSWLHGGDRELESLPHQSLVQATNLHFGARPNLKKILFDCKGSDVGVLVCGPRKMRHEVAKICSSGLAENLHFESISFNW
ncbi:Ferric reduction oxidase [Actinidia chinensis var. chinensis]|uniref:ferric-chelate reductase (NADH) n=1 Tax=Actinidia chinensis var. chinensis TaxID=1590841 RepID=A0A2R6Q917_ACTCC|nr:Ferric reduction oxidase [Actinidia chinensis var. chinensis]